MSADPFKAVYKQANLEAAWRAIEGNGRFSTSATVRSEIDQFRENASGKLRSLAYRLSRERFVFPPAKGLPIPKLRDGKKTGEFRPIVLASVESRIVQRAILNVLTDTEALRPYFESPFSFGGLRKRSETEPSAVPGAIACALQSIGDGATHVVSADITSFFTRIPKSRVINIVEKAVPNARFMALFEQAISVELANMAELRSRQSAFPIGEIGVAQGNSLSPLLGNICLSEFDKLMNEGDCRCVRYIDDILILAPTKRAASARLVKAKRYLSNLGMEFSAQKTSAEPIAIQKQFEFLGIEFANGLLRANSKSRERLITSIEAVFDKSCQGFVEASKSENTLDRGLSLTHTLRKVDGILNGWGKHYRFCNDGRVLEDLDRRVDELIRNYIGRYREMRQKADASRSRSLIGIALLSGIERTPLQWPKKARA
ncbi:hypothetical protein GCM10017620_13950 [Brevundimonas intermedia]|uniref:Reverse transcriptase domain-containing protein n=1 Tax=Brevundimonas intermedia TaxID=74315 RepID=A0ABQ5T757_9CAUL|nr:reverse transcriptase domain-containing protein [Brevundimonas intermedia]GLK48422.1 hypothetical protein GCM10017620_13950 [Brevundimonas intermedia]